MSDTSEADAFAFSAGELEDECGLHLVLRLEDGKWRACECASPVGEAGVRGGGRDGEGLEEVVESRGGYVMESGSSVVHSGCRRR